jgi:hypothetical protein
MLRFYVFFHLTLILQKKKKEEEEEEEEEVKGCAQRQHITLKEYIPILLGSALVVYAGYVPTANPNIEGFFASAAMPPGRCQGSKAKGQGGKSSRKELDLPVGYQPPVGPRFNKAMACK